MTTKIRVTVWGEYIKERRLPAVAKIYPTGMHETIAEALRESSDFEARTATLDQPEHGLTENVLDQTDVLIWWGHSAHGDVSDKIVDRVQARVLQGMGLIVLHSAHFSKIFKRLLGTTCSLTWREAGEKERLWVCNPGHPITQGIDRYFEIPHEEMYGEPFAIPAPDETVFVSWFQGGEVFRSGCTWKRGNGKIFYFRPGHETYPTYHQKEVRRVIQNAARWACTEGSRWIDSCPNVPIEKAAEKIVAQGATLHEPGQAGFL
jgi:trehalose utilization protein